MYFSLLRSKYCSRPSVKLYYAVLSHSKRPRKRQLILSVLESRRVDSHFIAEWLGGSPRNYSSPDSILVFISVSQL
jgi:hypothetical protein